MRRSRPDLCISAFLLCALGWKSPAAGDELRRATLTVSATGDHCVVFLQDHELWPDGSGAGSTWIDEGDPVHFLLCGSGRPKRLPEKSWLEESIKRDPKLREVEVEATKDPRFPTRACAAGLCLDLKREPPVVESSSREKAPRLPKAFRPAGAISSVVACDKAFLVWQSQGETTHLVYRWSPGSGSLEQFVLRR